VDVRNNSRSPLRDPVVRLAAALALAWMVGYALATSVVDPGELSGKLLADLVYPLPLAAGILAGILAVRRAEGRARRFWIVLLVAFALDLGANLVWTWIELVQGREVPYPSLADLLWIAGYPAAFVAIYVGFWRGSSLRVSRAWLDGSVLAAAVGYVGYVVLIEPQLEWGASLGTAVGIAYPLGDIVLVTLLASIAFCHSRLPLPLVLMALAWLSAGFGDIGYTYVESLNGYASGGWLDLAWQLEYVLFFVAAVSAVRFPAAGRERRLARDPGMVPVLIGAAVTVVFIAVEGADGDFQAGAAAVLVYVVAAVVLRLLLTSREKGGIARELERALEEQERLAITDQLTGLHNRRFFEESLRLEVERTLRSRRSLGLLVFDLDHFKQVNDRHGHPAGDLVLRETARRLQDCVRSSDVVARHGGEEFVILLPETDGEVLLELGERCRRAITERAFDVGEGERITVTISAGGATLPGDAAGGVALVRAADRALYRAKGRGRDRVEIGARRAGRGLQHAVGSGRRPGAAGGPSRVARGGRLR
jgi:diguanylate cyclase (GGDEF)-like protein